MFCDKCGTKVDENVKQCPNCGNQLQPMQVNTSKSQIGKKSKKKILCVSAAVILLAFIIVPSVYSSLPSTKVIKCLKGEEYDKAVQLYNKYYTDKKGDVLLNKGILSMAKKSRDDFFDQKVEYDDIYPLFSALYDMNLSETPIGDELKDISEDIENLDNDCEILKLIDAYTTQGAYEMAFSEYISLSDNSAFQQEADEKIAKTKELYKTYLYEEIDRYIQEESFSNLASFVYNALNDGYEDILGEDFCSEIYEKYYSFLNTQITGYLSKNEYQRAEYLISTATDYFGDDDKIAELSNSLEDSYVKISLDTAKQEFDNGNYEQAASIVQIAMEDIEDNKELINKYNEYKAYLPVYLNDLDYFNKTGSIYGNSNFDRVSDNTGKEYGRAYCIDGWGSNVYSAEYLINGNYTNFEGTAAVAYDLRDTEDSKFFEIYGDGILLYTSPVFTAGTMPSAFNIDVSGVKILKISYPDTNGQNKIASIFDGKLYNSSYTSLQDIQSEENTETTSTS